MTWPARAAGWRFCDPAMEQRKPLRACRRVLMPSGAAQTGDKVPVTFEFRKGRQGETLARRAGYRRAGAERRLRRQDIKKMPAGMKM
jgi:hypothetical protein